MANVAGAFVVAMCTTFLRFGGTSSMMASGKKIYESKLHLKKLDHNTNHTLYEKYIKINVLTDASRCEIAESNFIGHSLDG